MRGKPRSRHSFLKSNSPREMPGVTATVAPLHGRKHLDHAVEMVGHTDASQNAHLVAVLRCLGWYRLPRVADHLSYLRQSHLGANGITRQTTQQRIAPTHD